MSLPEHLLVRDLLRLRVRCSQGLDQGVGVMAWMHPPVHRLLGWVSRPSLFTDRRLVWRLNQLRDLGELELLVQGQPAETDADTVQQLPTLFDAALLDRQQQPIGTLVDAAVDRKTGQILHYLVSRSDPRLPGSSRWRLTTDRIVDQRPGLVFTNLLSLDDLPLARASVRQQLLSRSRRWREQMQEAGSNFEQRLEGWLEEPPWDGINPPDRSSGQSDFADEPWEWGEGNPREPQRPETRNAELDDQPDGPLSRSQRRSPLPPRQSRSRESLPLESRPNESRPSQSAPDPGDDANDPWV